MLIASGKDDGKVRGGGEGKGEGTGGKGCGRGVTGLTSITINELEEKKRFQLPGPFSVTLRQQQQPGKRIQRLTT